ATAQRDTEPRTGMRHAHSKGLSSRADDASKNATVASAKPAGGVANTKDVKIPRRLGAANSATTVIAPDSSAPAPIPCKRRRITSKTGAKVPIAAAVGSSPMPTGDRKGVV